MEEGGFQGCQLRRLRSCGHVNRPALHLAHLAAQARRGWDWHKSALATVYACQQRNFNSSWSRFDSSSIPGCVAAAARKWPCAALAGAAHAPLYLTPNPHPAPHQRQIATQRYTDVCFTSAPALSCDMQ